MQMSQSKANGNRSLLGKDDVRGQISEHIFAPNGGYCASSKKDVYCVSSNIFRNARWV